MTTPGAVRTKLWRTANKTRYNEYMAKYMQKKRQKQNEQKVSEEFAGQSPDSAMTGTPPAVAAADPANLPESPQP